MWFAGDIKIFCVIKNSDDYTAFKMITQWSVTWQLRFNILKCKCLHLGGPVHHFGFYTKVHTAHKDFGILFDEYLKFMHGHTTEVTAKVIQVLGMIKKSFEHLDSSMVTKLFTTLH